MNTVRIMLDYLQGPIWMSDPQTGRPKTGIEVIDEDEELRAISYEIQEMYFSYYELDSHDQACWFNEEQEKADKERMLELLGKLNARLEDINDGTFVVDDRETPRVRELASGD